MADLNGDHASLLADGQAYATEENIRMHISLTCSGYLGDLQTSQGRRAHQDVHFTRALQLLSEHRGAGSSPVSPPVKEMQFTRG